MIVGLWLSRNIKQIRGVMVAGSTLLLVLAGVLTYMYLAERGAGDTAEMLFRSDIMWYAPLNIQFSLGVDGISVAMLLLSAVIVFTGTFASWQMAVQTKEYFLWFCLLSLGVFRILHHNRLVCHVHVLRNCSYPDVLTHRSMG
jgi:NADH:ubiquinone oxidoreductase subunit 4 (chain M)